MHQINYTQLFIQDLLARPPPDEDAARRWNLRRLPVYAIDPFDAFEIDDGLSIEADENGDSWVYIHVADPTRYIPLQPSGALVSFRYLTVHPTDGSNQTVL